MIALSLETNEQHNLLHTVEVEKKIDKIKEKVCFQTFQMLCGMKRGSKLWVLPSHFLSPLLVLSLLFLISFFFLAKMSKNE